MCWALRASQGRIGDYRLGGVEAYAAAERSETGKLWRSEFDGSKPVRFKNSDLKSKCPSDTAYIHGETEMDLLM